MYFGYIWYSKKDFYCVFTYEKIGISRVTQTVLYYTAATTELQSSYCFIVQDKTIIVS